MDRLEIGVREFYEYYEKNDSKKFPSLSTQKEHQKVTFKLYKQIIIKFLTIYFYDVYFLYRPIYFFLGGSLMLTKCGNWIKSDYSKGVNGTRLKKVDATVGLYWFNRPVSRFEFAFKLLKLTGSTCRIKKIEKEYTNSHDVGVLNTILDLKKQGKKFTNTKRRC